MLADTGLRVCGEASVTEPETKGSAINQFTSYLVTVTLGGETLVARKRYSDFEWLRATLTNHFPGVPVWPLPRKQATGRFEASFIEARRAGLEVFLQHCLRRSQLSVDTPILKKFLRTKTDESMDLLKKEFESRPANVKCGEFKAAFSSDLRTSGIAPDEGKITTCKAFLEVHTSQLRELTDGLRDVADAQRAVTKAVSGAAGRVSKMCEHEFETLASVGLAENPRSELASVLRSQSRTMESFPAMHYDLLLSASEQEFLEAEAMHEAMESLEALHKELSDVEAKVTSLEETLIKVRAGGDVPSTGTGMARMLGISAPKDRDERIQQMEAELAEKQNEAAALKDFRAAARTVLATREIETFLHAKVAEHRQTKQSFADLSRKTAQALAQCWAANGVSGNGTSFSALGQLPRT
jgi:hypothetical protein